MDICKNCQHWLIDLNQIQIPGRGICLKTGTVEGQGQTTYTHESSNAYAVATVASTFSYQMVISQLETTKSFGCNQFEEKIELGNRQKQSADQCICNQINWTAGAHHHRDCPMWTEIKPTTYNK